MENSRTKVVVIGAGAAGLMAAGRAGERGLEVILVDKNTKAGKKILISGKGRCNISNNTDVEGLIENTPGNGSFLYSALYTFSNEDIISFFNSRGLETKVERGDRIFPVSDNAADVVDTLMSYVRKSQVKVQLGNGVVKVVTRDDKVVGVELSDGSVLTCDCAILATGGASYPGTGSTGDGYRIAKALGHTIIDLKPSLVPLVTVEEWVPQLQGLSLKNISITVNDSKGRKVYSDFGEMLFTHFGVSGPIILSGSRHMLKYGYKDLTMSIDLKPALDEEKLDTRVQRDFEKYSRKQFKNALDELLPQKLIPIIVMLSGIDEEKFVNQITREERRKLIKLLKGLPITIKGSRPITEAIVTAGGVCVDEINPSTMESKLIKGLYFAGEVIDVDAYTGGFNLTIAFSTGYLAGNNC